MEAKKISFGFTKVTKKPNLLASSKEAPKEENKVELIKCLEGQEIKLVEEKQEEAPLVIPMKENQKTSAALASLIKRRAVLFDEPEEPSAAVEPENQNATITEPTSNGTTIVSESLEQRAAREILAAIQSNGDTEEKDIVLPLVKADELPLDGAKESTLGDYEDIPVRQFGMAMLRGMGWVEPPQKKGGALVEEAPFVRPKGMGLGADKALKPKPLLVQPEANEVLEIKRQAYVRILGGKHKDLYGQIEGFDDHAGRVIVKMAIGGGKEAFNEFLCQAVAKKEFTQYGKCINTVKYEEYKKLENEHGQIILKKDNADEKSRVKKEPSERKRSDDREYQRKREIDDSRRDDKLRDSHRSDKDNRSPRCSKSREDSRRHYDDDDERREAATRYNDGDGRPRNDSYHASSSTSRYRDGERQSGSKSRKSRSRERNDYRGQSGSSSHRRPQDPSSHPRSDSTDDTSESSGTDSDSDSAYERKHKKKSSSKVKSKKKSGKKGKRSKSRRRRRHDTPSTESSSDELSSSEEERSRSRHHKKKTKKSKKPRSRTRSNSRSKARR